jgi:hypothetical protein
VKHVQAGLTVFVLLLAFIIIGVGFAKTFGEPLPSHDGFYCDDMRPRGC